MVIGAAEFIAVNDKERAERAKRLEAYKECLEEKTREKRKKE